MTLNEFYAVAVIREAKMETPADVERFVAAVQVLFPDYDRDFILSMQVERMSQELKLRAAELNGEMEESRLRIQGADAVGKAKKILGNAGDG